MTKADLSAEMKTVGSTAAETETKNQGLRDLADRGFQDRRTEERNSILHMTNEDSYRPGESKGASVHAEKAGEATATLRRDAATEARAAMAILQKDAVTEAHAAMETLRRDAATEVRAAMATLRRDAVTEVRAAMETLQRDAATEARAAMAILQRDAAMEVLAAMAILQRDAAMVRASLSEPERVPVRDASLQEGNRPNRSAKLLQ